MAALGLTGILRGESGAVSAEERQSRLGRVMAMILGSIWLLTGALYLIGGAVDDNRRYAVVGYTSLVSMIAFLLVLSTSLLAFSIHSLLGRRVRQLQRKTPVMLPPPGYHHFRRLQPVTHPVLGGGIVLDSYFSEGREMVSVLFRDETLSIPADQLEARLMADG